MHTFHIINMYINKHTHIYIYIYNMLPQVGICIAIRPDSSRPSKMGHLLNVNFAVVFHIPKKGEWPRKIQRLQEFVISWQVLRA